MRYFENNFYCQKHSFASEPLREISKIICAHLYYFKWLHPFPNFNYLLLQNFSRLTKYISNSYLFFFSKSLFFIVGILSSVCVYVGRCLLSLKYIFAWKRSKFRCTVNPLFGGRWEEGSGWGTHVYLWRIHFAYVFNSDGSLCIQFVFTENNKAKNIYVGSV